MTALDRARRQAMLPRFELWLRYFGLGGVADLEELTGYLAGDGTLSSIEHNLVVLALNEHYLDLGGDHPVPYLEV